MIYSNEALRAGGLDVGEIRGVGQGRGGQERKEEGRARNPAYEMMQYSLDALLI